MRSSGRFCSSGPLVVSLVGGGEGYRPYFENYTVDASILQSVFGWLRKMILKIISQSQCLFVGCCDRFKLM